MKRSPTLHRALCILLSLLLLFLLAAVPRRVARSEPREQVFSASAATMLEGGNVGLRNLSVTVTAENGLALNRLTEEGDTPVLSYRADGQADTLRVTLAAPVADPVLTYVKAGVISYGSVRPVAAETGEDGSVTYLFLLLTENAADTYDLAFGESYTLRSVTHERLTTPGTAYRINLLPLILFTLLLGTLLLLEKKLRFFRTLRDTVASVCNGLCTLSCGHRIAAVIALLAIALYALAAYLDLAFSLTLPFFSYLLFALAPFAIAGVLTLSLLPSRPLSFPKVFFLSAAVAGSALALLLPPTLGLSWDDEYHFMHMACPAAFLNLGHMPFSIQHLSSTVGNFPQFFADTETFSSYLLRLETFSSPLPQTITLPSIHPVLLVLAAPFALIFAAYRYAVYLPGILLCLFGFLAGADTLFILASARLAYLFFFVTVFALAIRRLKYGRHLFAVTALLPTALYLAVNFTCDTFIFALTALGFAYFIGELQRKDEPLSTKNAIIMLSAVALAAAPKPIYFILLAPMLFLPKEKLGSPRRTLLFRAAVLLLMVLVALTFVLPFLVNTNTYTDVRGGADVSASGQIKYILTHPFAYAKTFFRFVSNWFSFSETAPYAVFYAYVHRGSGFLGTLYMTLLLLVAVTDRTREREYDLSIKPRYRITSLLSLFLAVCLIVTSLYVGFTPVGATVVNGCQFRYAFPLLPLLLYALCSIRLRSFTGEGKMTVLSLGGGCLLNLILFYEAIIERLSA